MPRDYKREDENRTKRLARVPMILERLKEQGVMIIHFSSETDHYRLNEVLDWWPNTGIYRKVNGKATDAYMKTRVLIDNACKHVDIATKDAVF